MQVLRARASDLEQEFAFGVVRQLFEGLLDRADPETRPALFRGAAALASPLFDLAPVAAAGGRYIEESGGAAETTAGGRPAGDLSFTLVHGLYWLTNEPHGDRAGDDRGRRRALGRRFIAAVPGVPGRAVRGARRARGADRARGRADPSREVLTTLRNEPGAILVMPESLSDAAAARLVRSALGENADTELLLGLRPCQRRQSVPAARADRRARAPNASSPFPPTPRASRACGRARSRTRWSRGLAGSAATRARWRGRSPCSKAPRCARRRRSPESIRSAPARPRTG